MWSLASMWGTPMEKEKLPMGTWMTPQCPVGPPLPPLQQLSSMWRMSGGMVGDTSRTQKGSARCTLKYTLISMVRHMVLSVKGCWKEGWHKWNTTLVIFIPHVHIHTCTQAPGISLPPSLPPSFPLSFPPLFTHTHSHNTRL